MKPKVTITIIVSMCIYIMTLILLYYGPNIMIFNFNAQSFNTMNISSQMFNMTPACPLTNESNIYYVNVVVNKTKLTNKMIYKRQKQKKTFKVDECWRQINKDKLIIFLHFHKAGGTSICDSARSVTIFAEPNGNGNPRQFSIAKWKIFNYRIPFWDFNLHSLTSYFNQLRLQNVSFIAMENDYFPNTNYLNIINSIKIGFAQNIQYKIEMITQFRDPFNRFVSDFFFALNIRRYKETHSFRFKNIKERLLSFHNHYRKTYNNHNVSSRIYGGEWNMYTRVLSHEYRNTLINQTHLEIAKNELTKFDVITILEKPETYKLMAIKYGIQHNLHQMHQNCCDNKRKRLRSNLKLLSKNDTYTLKLFENTYKILNKYDYILYDYAIELSLKPTFY